MRSAALAFVAFFTVFSLSPASARPQATPLSLDCNPMMPCQSPAGVAAISPDFGLFGEAPQQLQRETAGLSPRARRALRRAERRAARVAARQERVAPARLRQAMAYASEATFPDAGEVQFGAPASTPAIRATASTSMRGIVPGLAAKVAQIQATCPGAHVISAVRHTHIRGTRRMSLHASGEAVDMRGNPSCVYAQLRDWPGGYSTDYGRAKHIHISLSSSGREMGLRFAHGGHRRHHRIAAR